MSKTRKGTKSVGLKVIFKPLRSMAGWYYQLENRQGEIQINKNLTQFQKILTLYHEFTHFIVDLLSSDNAPKYFAYPKIPPKKVKVVSAFQTNKTEERLCEAVARTAAKEIKHYLHR